MAPSTAHDPLRPARLAEFTGQPDVVTELGIILTGAASRDELPPHILLAGPPGLGKTTLANIIATETHLPILTTSGPAIDKPADLVGLLVAMTRPSVVFIDEIHRLPLPVQEILYTAMEDGRVDIVVGEGTAKARAIPMPLEPFVLVGATTRAGQLGGPLRDRFGYTARLNTYDVPTLARIVARSAGLLQMDLTEQAATVIASRSRGTPRVANTWLRRVRDYAAHTGRTGVDADLAAQALDLFGIDSAGLDKVDRALLTALVTKFGGGPVGLNVLAATINEEPSTLEEVHEPHLMRSGLLDRTRSGRRATAATYRHLGHPVPPGIDQASSRPTLTGLVDG
jgi:Holliday junction DNA helicase RuvB